MQNTVSESEAISRYYDHVYSECTALSTMLLLFDGYVFRAFEAHCTFFVGIEPRSTGCEASLTAIPAQRFSLPWLARLAYLNRSSAIVLDVNVKAYAEANEF